MARILRYWPALLLLLLGGAFMAAGWAMGEGEIVFLKAINICLECIGIG